MTALPRRLVLLAAPALALAGAASASDPVALFQVTGPRDTIVIGVMPRELESWGRGEAVSVVAERLQEADTITVWQYVVGRAQDGSLRMQPRARIALLRNDAMRIAPYTAAHPVAAPQN